MISRRLPLRVIASAHHRNGIAGAPFHVVLFDDADSRKVGLVFGGSRAMRAKTHDFISTKNQ